MAGGGTPMPQSGTPTPTSAPQPAVQGDPQPQGTPAPGVSRGSTPGISQIAGAPCPGVWVSLWGAGEEHLEIVPDQLWDVQWRKNAGKERDKGIKSAGDL